MHALPPPTRDSSGGQGAGAPVPELSREDIRMVGQAIRGRWPIRPESRQRIIDTLTLIATHPEVVGSREAVAAAKALLDADKINQEEELRERKQPQLIQDPTGKTRVDFTTFSDEELDAYLEGR